MQTFRRAPATAKLNLALVVGPRRTDGRHEVVSVLQRLALADRVSLQPAEHLAVTGFADDTIVRAALQLLAGRAGIEPRWRAHIVKRIPVAAGLGGGSSDAATALRLANALLPEPFGDSDLAAVAAELGADVPFFLTSGAQLAERDGTALTPRALPADYWVVLVLPSGARKASTAAVYEAFDRRGGERRFPARRQELLDALAGVRAACDLSRLPANDLLPSATLAPAVAELRAYGAFRADVTGAGPVVYGLFLERDRAEAARRRLRALGRTWLTVPAWYG